MPLSFLLNKGTKNRSSDQAKEGWPRGTFDPLSSKDERGLFKIYLRRKLSMPRDLHFYNGIEILEMKA